MLDLFFQQLSEQSLFAIGLGAAVGFVFCLAVHMSPLRHLTNNYYSFLGPQKIHTDPTPRIGGLGLIIAMFVQALFLPDESSQLLLMILVSSSELIRNQNHHALYTRWHLCQQWIE